MVSIAIFNIPTTSPLENKHCLNRSIPISVSPFTINGNADWDILNSTYAWCSGNGTSENPFIISNISIEGSFTGHCLENLAIQTVYFVVRNSTFFYSGTDDYAGIKLENVTNALIVNNTLRDNYWFGIYSNEIYDGTFANNTCWNNGNSGLKFENGVNIIVYGNNVSTTDVGINIAGTNFTVL